MYLISAAITTITSFWRLPPLYYFSRYWERRLRYETLVRSQNSALRSEEQETGTWNPDEGATEGISMTQIQGRPGRGPRGLLRVLSLYPSMDEITRSLHQADIVNLTLTSKDVRNSVFTGIGSDINSLKGQHSSDILNSHHSFENNGTLRQLSGVLDHK